jgi:hypothetical protein
MRSRVRAAAAADRVGTILAAAEQAAERVRAETEARMRERIAEGERAAENRVQAAEEEANEIGRLAREEAEHAKTVATTEAQEILAKAYEDANRTREEGEDAKAASNSEALTILARAQEQAEANLAKAQAQSRELLGTPVWSPGSTASTTARAGLQRPARASGNRARVGEDVASCSRGRQMSTDWISRSSSRRSRGCLKALLTGLRPRRTPKVRSICSASIAANLTEPSCCPRGVSRACTGCIFD